MKFWDASALVPLLIDEAETSRARQLYDDDRAQVIWWGTRVECRSAIERSVREGRLHSQAEVRARVEMDAMLHDADEVAPSEEVRQRAMRLLVVHPLRAADALQLGAALIWARDRPAGHGFVCFDGRLREAAGREGFDILPSTI